MFRIVSLKNDNTLTTDHNKTDMNNDNIHSPNPDDL